LARANGAGRFGAGKSDVRRKTVVPDSEQGAKLVESEKKTKNIIQVGMQRRSYDLYLKAGT
jgi:hypothetical protein